MTDTLRIQLYKQTHHGSILAVAPDKKRVFISALEADDFTKDVAWVTVNHWEGGVTVECLISSVDWASWVEALSVSDQAFSSGHPALSFAPSINLDLPDVDALRFSDVIEGQHFSVSELNGRYHWESLEEYADEGQAFDTLGAADGFDNCALAKADAQTTISTITAYGVNDGFALLDYDSLMRSRMWASDIADISDAVKSMPVDERFIAAYRMALRTKLMPEQYWPEHQESAS